MSNAPFAPERISDVERVVADPMRFKRRLRIGRKAFKILNAKDAIYSFWDTAGVATTGAAVAKSSIVATTFFAPTGIVAWLGLATAATPIGWVVAAAAVSGTVYYGASRYFSSDESRYIDVIPKFINTPIDLLAFNLFGLIGGLAIRVTAFNAPLAPSERSTIVDHFCQEWGYDAAFVERSLPLLEANVGCASTTEVARALADFQARNPDCNRPAMQRELLVFLREVVEADGVVSDQERVALDEVAAAFESQWQEALSVLRDQAGRSASKIGEAAGEVASTIGALGDTARTLTGQFAGAVTKLRKRWAPR